MILLMSYQNAPAWISRLNKHVTNAHILQMYGDEEYMFHINEVVSETNEILYKRGITGEEYWKYIGVALGHDVVEDTNTTLDVLAMGLNIPIDVVNGIDMMTKRKGEYRTDYIDRVKMDKYSHLVKQADSLRNLTHSIRAGSERRVRKYTGYLSLLSVRDLYIVKGSPNQNRLRFVSYDDLDRTHAHLRNQDGDLLLFAMEKLEQI